MGINVWVITNKTHILLSLQTQIGKYKITSIYIYIKYIYWTGTASHNIQKKTEGAQNHKYTHFRPQKKKTSEMGLLWQYNELAKIM